jgi:circadian clock protein KaiC
MTGRSTMQLETTSIPDLDTILGGGLPRGSVTVIAGEPGAGKTVLTLQMLFHAASSGARCLYFTTLSEPAMKVVRYMQAFDFFDEALFDRNIIFADLGAAIREGADSIINEVVGRVERHEPAFVAIDSFRVIGERLRADVARPFVYDLATQMAGWGATTLLVGEYARAEFAAFAEFAIADGILRLGSEPHGLTSLREIEVLKLRGAAYVSGRHFFDIGSAGVAVYPRVRGPDHPSEDDTRSPERIGTGVAGIDELLDGGLPRGSSTVIQGGTGTGKTTLALNFLVEGLRCGEPGILFTLEENPAQLRQVARGLGWDLDGLAIRYSSPVELSTDRFLNDARAEVQKVGARRVVFDSLTTMALGVMSDRRFKELVYAVAKHMRSAGATLYMTLESEQHLGSANLSGLGVSFIADNLVQLRYVEIGGRLERALSVIKARGVKLNTELCSATIARGGITVTRGRFKEMRGLLTGMPSRGE